MVVDYKNGSAYLKVERKDNSASWNPLFILEDDYQEAQARANRLGEEPKIASFGTLLRSSIGTLDWHLYHIFLNSKDLGGKGRFCVYETCESAVNAAIELFDEYGFKAKPIPLEEFVNRA